MSTPIERDYHNRYQAFLRWSQLAQIPAQSNEEIDDALTLMMNEMFFEGSPGTDARNSADDPSRIAADASPTRMSLKRKLPHGNTESKDPRLPYMLGAPTFPSAPEKPPVKMTSSFSEMRKLLQAPSIATGATPKMPQMTKSSIFQEGKKPVMPNKDRAVLIHREVV